MLEQLDWLPKQLLEDLLNSGIEIGDHDDRTRSLNEVAGMGKETIGARELENKLKELLRVDTGKPAEVLMPTRAMLALYCPKT